MRLPLSLVLPFALLLTVPVAQAQVAPQIGAMVRIKSEEFPRGPLIGDLQRVTSDSLVVSGVAISRRSITRFDVSTGRKSQLLKGMGIGFLSGAVVGGVGCRFVCGVGSDGEIQAIVTAVGAGAGGLLGLAIGAGVGAKKTEQWRASSLSTLRISPMVRSNGGIGVSFGFQF